MQIARLPTVLIVEDDPLVRDVIAETLSEAGLVVAAAACAEEALRALANGRIDAVITDIDMPGEVDGVELARRVGECKPEVGVILISGGAARALPPGTRFVAKPFTARDLLRSLAALMGEPLYAAS